MDKFGLIYKFINTHIDFNTTCIDNYKKLCSPVVKITEPEDTDIKSIKASASEYTQRLEKLRSEVETFVPQTYIKHKGGNNSTITVFLF